MNVMESVSVSAIVPFYNEGNRILYVLDILKDLQNVDEIICVDDGSTDNAIEKVRERDTNIIVLENPYNQGKSAAIAKGISYASGEYIFLIDADMSNLRKDELETAITKAKQADISMIILKRIHDPLVAKITRGDVLVSGERILKKSDLLEVLKTNPRHFQIETAINLYMMNNKKIVYWYPHSGKNFHKIKKKGLPRGVFEELAMNYSMYAFAGVLQYLKLMVLFCNHRM
jgi:glycosyltransferase involved in cell wall biosynthesis